MINQLFQNVNSKTVKKTTKTDYCANHKHKCLDNDCDTRIMKNDSYCKIHK